MESYLFWPFKVAKEIIKEFPNVKKHIIATGTSISGEPHIGNSNDVIRGHFIEIALKDLGTDAELVWISDDLDPLRSVPKGLPNELIEYLGIPVCNIPDIFGCHKSFTSHYEDIFLEQLEKVFVKPKVFLGMEMYKNGLYNESIRIAMEKRSEIIKILNKYRKEPLDETWYPIDVICKNCGKISTTRILSYDKENFRVKYVCEKTKKVLHKKYEIEGCGYEDEVSIFNGTTKLTWRVEWPARWAFLKVTCEPFGKEHAASGGSWDTAKEIVKIFNWEPPFPIVYEHFLVNGEKMSKSKGNVITVDDVLNFILPEHLRYWMAQGKLTIAKDIRLSTLVPRVFDEFDFAERVYFGLETSGNKKKDNNFKSAYKLAVVNVKAKKTFNVSFFKIVEIIENFGEEFLEKKLRELKFDFDEERLKERVRLIKNWMEKYYKKKEDFVVSTNYKPFIEELIEAINSEEELEKRIFEIAKKSGDVKEFFKTIYRILLNKESGPRLSNYIKEVGKEKVLEKLKKAIQ
ncbi:MAG: lysine--tRNA ligase [Candidatus Aenigmarchaeota archaeon]|nr:lysine--tRNA ligase [Candidatus Aenigmarchaeota archaeon]MDW8149458.1 lysine--tRNA ligase [Candidatus Aenigmarchaeota archaeon]